MSSDKRISSRMAPIIMNPNNLTRVECNIASKIYTIYKSSSRRYQKYLCIYIYYISFFFAFFIYLRCYLTDSSLCHVIDDCPSTVTGTYVSVVRSHEFDPRVIVEMFFRQVSGASWPLVAKNCRSSNLMTILIGINYGERGKNGKLPPSEKIWYGNASLSWNLL